MAAIKSYTDLEQSRKLAEFLPLESADMMYHSVETEYGSGAFVATSKVITNGLKNDDFYVDDIPCWSLAALLKLIPNFNMFKRTIECRIETTNHLVDKACEPIDAAFEMVLKLHELGLL